MLKIKKFKHKGRGVITDTDIKKDSVIISSPVMVISKKEMKHFKKLGLYDYSFDWSFGRQALSMDITNFLNHSYTPNAMTVVDYSNTEIIFVALKDIKKGQEILINYNGKVDDNSPLWFKVK